MPALSLSLANSIMMRNALHHIISKEKARAHQEKKEKKEKKKEPTKPKRKKVRSHS